MKASGVKMFVYTFALLLVLPVQCKFNFGDLIAIDMESVGEPPMPVYVHWAIYVGKGMVTGLENIKKDNEDIFHIYGGDITEVAYCVFDTLAEIPGTPTKLLLDKDSNGKSLNVEKNETLVEHIKILHKNCTWWEPEMRGCKHVLFYVRFGGKCMLPEDESKNKPIRSTSFHMA